MKYSAPRIIRHRFIRHPGILDRKIYPLETGYTNTCILPRIIRHRFIRHPGISDTNFCPPGQKMHYFYPGLFDTCIKKEAVLYHSLVSSIFLYKFRFFVNSRSRKIPKKRIWVIFLVCLAEIDRYFSTMLNNFGQKLALREYAGSGLFDTPAYPTLIFSPLRC